MDADGGGKFTVVIDIDGFEWVGEQDRAHPLVLGTDGIRRAEEWTRYSARSPPITLLLNSTSQAYTAPTAIPRMVFTLLSRGAWRNPALR